ncbi:hypothetical protein M409DRAFT_28114 [Zasmidium cellare ATCC 36951]|uniref:Uncharacterized protein n=1 Tax=Zasmidium cellare ATCC 36951 TaxID=1080233 RepID=A0A6A6C5B2_ZASCE|nr:uncharacterized protein M409DRAFT_28114 [Zasmidium cellare ATCC 36951]KAF2161380.1 hypothetical protein M409DRAFT_28114 [Zasmidium cellare ATCC 36951]
MRCTIRNLTCNYEGLEAGVTKRESMKRDLSGTRRQLEDALAILDVMRYGTDMVATETLARLRLGMDLGDVLGLHGVGGEWRDEEGEVGEVEGEVEVEGEKTVDG